MKFNKWTLGLAAVGAVSLASAARAEEAKMSAVQTALSNTTISGYVSSSMNWSMDPNSGSDLKNSPGGNIPLQQNKENGFNLDVLKISIAKPMENTEWSSGYQVDMIFGPDAVGWNPSSNNTSDGNVDFAIQQAYIALNTPVGNGIDWKVGVFNSVVGFESFDGGNNPNYTRSWGWSVEPTEHTGILGSYMFCDCFAMQAGVANTLHTGINTRDSYNTSSGRDWHKTMMGSAVFTAPDSWGWAAKSHFYAGMVYGFGSNGTEANGGSQGGNQVNYYVGAKLNSPWEKIKFGAAFDYVQNLYGGAYDNATLDSNVSHVNDYIGSLYNTIKATEKLSFNTRAEFWYVQGKGGNGGYDNGVSLTETLQYDLWANVISRLEFRYDKATRSVESSGNYVLPNGTVVTEASSFGLYANFIYKF